MLAGRLCLRRIVERAEHRIAVAYRTLEIVLADLQVAGDRLQDLQPSGVESRVEIPERVLEARYLGRPEIVGHMIAKPVAPGQVAANVPEFLEVVRFRAL